MGSKLPLFEKDIIDPEIKKRNILGYVRYVDDILVVVKRGYIKADY
jgi:hypothetical protein